LVAALQFLKYPINHFSLILIVLASWTVVKLVELYTGLHVVPG